MTCRRSTTVVALNSVSSKTPGSGQKVTIVPRRPRGEGPAVSSFPLGFPPLANSIRWRVPSRSISSTSRRDSAFTTDTPTPCSPPDTL